MLTGMYSVSATYNNKISEEEKTNIVIDQRKKLGAKLIDVISSYTDGNAEIGFIWNGVSLNFHDNGTVTSTQKCLLFYSRSDDCPVGEMVSRLEFGASFDTMTRNGKEFIKCVVGDHGGIAYKRVK